MVVYLADKGKMPKWRSVIPGRATREPGISCRNLQISGSRLQARRVMTGISYPPSTRQ
jgi:hypothetical protein